MDPNKREVEFWVSEDGKNPVGEFIENLENPKAQKKILTTLGYCETFEITQLYRAEILEKINYRGNVLYEVRILFNKIAYRIICVIRGATIWLLHAIIKKRDKIPPHELEVAQNRANNLDRRLALGMAMA